MNILFLLLLSISCAKMSVIAKARLAFGSEIGAECNDILKAKMKETDCKILQVKETKEWFLLRCYKKDGDRGKFWDNYVFRISNSKLKFASEEDKKIVSDHTICVDDNVRIEAYPPGGN